MWGLYNTLIQGIDPNARAEFVFLGQIQAYVASDSGAGMAMLSPLPGKGREVQVLPGLAGKPLRELAELAKSWDEAEAAVGVAAMNAWYNRPARLKEQGALFCAAHGEEGDVFRSQREAAAGKIVSVVGGFPGAAVLAEHAAKLRIFEREPEEGEYPDAAEEYLLPGSDITIVTGMTVTNKTVVRILQLAEKSLVYLTGPSVPMAPQLQSFGVNGLFGSVIVDEAGCRACLLGGGSQQRAWDYMQKVVLRL